MILFVGVVFPNRHSEVVFSLIVNIWYLVVTVVVFLLRLISGLR